ncbi:hypothetical protein ASE49_08090 [Novosphingobium sp. Leaf2]|nr:hypothetical protein ASE49_08090 [Novosphingobium sp. Leaf2]
MTRSRLLIVTVLVAGAAVTFATGASAQIRYKSTPRPSAWLALEAEFPVEATGNLKDEVLIGRGVHKTRAVV